MAPPDTATELARRVVAQILLSETSATFTKELDVVAVLGELLALVILKTLRISTTFAIHTSRTQLNIFDVLKGLPTFKMDITQLYEFLTPRQVRQKNLLKPPIVAPSGRSLLRAAGDDEDDEEPVDLGPRPVYLTDIYPPFPRPYTFRRTETRGIRENDKVLIAKAKAEQQRQVESNLYRLLAKTHALREIVNYEDDL